MDEIIDELNENKNADRSFTLADKGKRFFNYIIDLFGCLVFLALISIFIELYYISSNGTNMLLEQETTGQTRMLDWLINAISTIIYYTSFEYFADGKTLGKFATKTRAVNRDNSKMGFTTTLNRTLIRIIPLEPLSYLNHGPFGWHDKFSKTKVIDDVNWYNQ